MRIFRKNYVANLRGHKCRISCQDLTNFARSYPLPEAVDNRTSELFWVDLCIYFREFNIEPNNVLSEIIALERENNMLVETKLAQPFRKNPLKGLYHKHWFDARFVPQNLLNVFGSPSFNDEMDVLLFEAQSATDKERKAQEIVHKMTFGALEQRANENRLTGEWIIFDTHEGNNYYLCLGTHDSEDEFLAQRISLHCSEQFPFLPWLLQRGKDFPRPTCGDSISQNCDLEDGF